MTERQVELKTEDTDGVTVIAITGALDASNLRTFKNMLDPIVEEQQTAVLLDCSKLTYASSQAFGLFSCYHKITRTKQIIFALCAINKQMYNILDLLGLAAVFNIYETKEKALAAIKQLNKV